MQVQGKERVYRGVVQARPPGPLQQCTLRVLERRLLHSRVDSKPGLRVSALTAHGRRGAGLNTHVQNGRHGVHVQGCAPASVGRF